MTMINKLVFPLISILWSFTVSAQSNRLYNPDLVQGSLIKLSKPVSELTVNKKAEAIITKKPKIGYHPKKDWPLHKSVNPNALPVSDDLSHQKRYNTESTTRNILTSFNGIGNTNVNPSDACVAVGPNHVVQMINGSSGAYFKVYNKDGNIIKNTMYFDILTGISGGGDPIVIYDQLADRWLMSEFANIGNKLIVAVSQTNDPTGSYYVYSFTAPGFPDYPKYALWPDAYYITTNENIDSPIYAIDRNKMLEGAQTVGLQRFTIPDYSGLGFQAATPVTLDGMTPPPAGTPGMMMRMADDAWDTNVTSDRLEIFKFYVDFSNPSNSHLDGPIILNTEPFDTDLCGFTSFSCIDQPGTHIDLDPLREVLMHRVSYRNFGNYEAIACNHVVDVNGNDRAGIRWYELRKESTDWNIHQQSTYAPIDDASRWMASISMNDEGSIGLAYNVSSASIYPSIRFTGRTGCDALGQMTIAEQSLKEGTSFNNSNRWGDYSCLVTDPSDGSFWYTGSYASAGTWSTYIGNFDVDYNCSGILFDIENNVQVVCPSESAEYELDLSYMGDHNHPTVFTIENLPPGLDYSFESGSVVNSEGMYTLEIEQNVELFPGEYNFEVKAVSNGEIEMVYASLIIDNEMTEDIVLMYPSNQSTAMSYMTYFEWSNVDYTNTYNLEISEDPLMTNGMLVYEGMIDSYYTVLNGLEEDKQYYWRVHALNMCGQMVSSEIYTFSTGTSGCDMPKNDTAIVIPHQGTAVIESIITVENPGAITGISVSNIDITHTWVSDLEIYLTSPAGTQITLLDGLCYNQDDIFLGLDDAGLEQNSIPCPPTDGTTYKPLQDLSTFINEEAAGDWKLTIVDKYNMDGGFLNSWELNICNMSESACEGTYADNGGEIESGTYQANNNLHSSGYINSPNDVTFRASQSVNLNGGFEVKSGASFEVEIGDCENN